MAGASRPTPAVYANGRLSFEVSLRAGRDAGTAACCTTCSTATQHSIAAPTCAASRAASIDARRVARPTGSETVLKIRTSNEEFYRFYHQAIDDMAALRLPIDGTDHMVFVPAAGLPWFVAPVRPRQPDRLAAEHRWSIRSSRAARWMCSARWQAKERDDYRDAEPGKIMHELRYGELAHFKLIPHTPYYGTADATPLYLITLHAAWRATGDRALLEQHLPTRRGAA